MTLCPRCRRMTTLGAPHDADPRPQTECHSCGYIGRPAAREAALPAIRRSAQAAEPPEAMPALTYIYRWYRMGRKGQPCAVLARGKLNSCLVQFADGHRAITSRNAVRRRKP